MQAFVDGKQVEAKSKNECVWGICFDPVWDWKHLDYRIRPELRESTYRPYKDFAEFRKDWEKHGGWVKDYADNDIRLCNAFSPQWYFNNYVWADDGSPCGVKVEE